jgi:hypothetical protein
MHHTNEQPLDTFTPPRSSADWRSRARRAMLAATGSLLAAAAVAVPATAA